VAKPHDSEAPDAVHAGSVRSASTELPAGSATVTVPGTTTAPSVTLTSYMASVPGGDTCGVRTLIETPTSTTVNPPLSPYPSSFTRARGSAREQELQATIQFLAQETGGRPLLNGNRTLGLASADEDTRSYYWLGFTPPWQRDSRSHRIEVEVLRQGVQVRARRGYLDLSPQTETMMKVESALLFGELPEAEPLAIHLGPPVKGKKARITEIPVTLDIPASVLTLLPDQGRYTSRAELRLAALDEQGNQSTVPTVPLRLISPRQPAPNSKMRYETRISLRGRANRIVALIYDPLSGKIAAGRVDVTLP